LNKISRTPEEVIQDHHRSVRLRVTPRLWAILERYRISFGARNAARLPFLDLPKTARIESYADFTNGTTAHSLGAFSYTMTAEPAIVAGRYCSIADQTMVMGERHPVEHVTTSTFPYRIPRPSFAWAREDLLEGDQSLVAPSIATQGPAVLEHDVWTGNRAILARGITLHTGCIVGAASVVTRDVPPYAIVAGNPARTVRLRFPEKLVARLLASRWWECHPKILFDSDIRSPERFLDDLEQARSSLPDFTPQVLTWPLLQRELLGETPA
jgi:acetyltransferase-like isoleucine patch superfamily enzyme